MDGAQLSRFPHLSWLGFFFESSPASGTLCHNLNGKTHCLNLPFYGRGLVRWISRGRESRYAASAGVMHFLPADGESHTILADVDRVALAYTLFLPRGHLDAVTAADHVPACVEYNRLVIQDDAVLRSCMIRIAKPTPASDACSGAAQDEAARRLVLRLVELSGGGRPDWGDDASVFDRRTLGNVVEYIDAHLKIPPCLSDLGTRVGLSPSHFAKKFRQSTGLSLHRFVNRRRIRASLEALKDQGRPLSHIALEIGFSSQAHFTHMFAGITSMTPARYRKQFRRTVG